MSSQHTLGLLEQEQLERVWVQRRRHSGGEARA